MAFVKSHVTGHELQVMPLQYCDFQRSRNALPKEAASVRSAFLDVSSMNVFLHNRCSADANDVKSVLAGGVALSSAPEPGGGICLRWQTGSRVDTT